MVKTASRVRVHGHVQGSCTRSVYTAVYRPCPRTVRVHGRVHSSSTSRVHGRVRAVCTARKRPCGCVHEPCTTVLCIRPVHGPCSRSCTGRVHGTRCTCTRPCMDRVHGRVRAAYTAVYGPCTRAVYMVYLTYLA